jgi:hypothetical protein
MVVKYLSYMGSLRNACNEGFFFQFCDIENLANFSNKISCMYIRNTIFARLFLIFFWKNDKKFPPKQLLHVTSKLSILIKPFNSSLLYLHKESIEVL